MSYSRSILGKDIDELTYQDLTNYFQNPRQESNIVEYKSFNPTGDFESKFNGIYQTVCAFLNSEGGILVWGAPKGRRLEGRREKEFSGDLTPINRITEKDYLINKLSGNITPLPNKIITKIIEYEGNSIVIIEVEKSLYAPHQTRNTYYMRLDGQSKPAPHYYIEALFKQIRYPDLGGYIKFESIRRDKGFYRLRIKIIVVNHSSILNEENVSFRLICDNGTFNHQYGNNNPKITVNDNQLYSENFAKILHYGATPFCDATIIYNINQISGDDYKSLFILMFGGKKSPMKNSEYRIRLVDLDPENLNDSVYEVNENILMYEKGVDKGSETEKINRFLGRV